MFIILSLFAVSSKNSVNATIKKIRDGDKLLKNRFINDYRPFIIKCVSQVTGRYVEIQNSEEYSVGLLAFNEAIDCYNEIKNTNFFNFSRQVIKRRVIDYIRQNQKNNNVYPFTYFEDGENNSLEEKYLASDPASDFDNIETKDEIRLFEQKLKEFNITLEDLVSCSPKHKDSKQLSIKTARLIADNHDMFEKLDRKKTIPMADLMKIANVSRRTVERNRKFIIAVCMILRSDLDVLKGYVRNTEELEGNL